VESAVSRWAFDMGQSRARESRAGQSLQSPARVRQAGLVTQTSRRSLSCTPLFRICVWCRIPSCITTQVAAEVDKTSFARRSVSNGRPRIRTARDIRAWLRINSKNSQAVPTSHWFVRSRASQGHHKGTTRTAPTRPRMQVARTANPHRIRQGLFQGTGSRLGGSWPGWPADQERYLAIESR
jgi:hypothetical protein